MTRAPNLLNDDGSASIATALLMSHHAFRRDIAQLALALKRIADGDASRAQALKEEWQGYRGALHGHHEVEDTRIFPSLKDEQPQLAVTIAQLVDDHRHIDPLLERGDRAFSELPTTLNDAVAIVSELTALLDKHLPLEEAEVVPFLRSAHEFPPPASEEEANMYADGFAWSSHGVAPDVLEKVYAMLPDMLRAKLPAARAAYEERCMRSWGSKATGASRTAVPDWLAR